MIVTYQTPMARFRIWCRADEVGTGQHLAVVSAIPDRADASPAPIESESRLLATRQLAIEACAHMVQSFRRRIEARGDQVSVVEMV